MRKGDEDRWVPKWIYDRYKTNKNTANPALINKRKRKERKPQTRNGGHSSGYTSFAMMLKILVMSSFSLTFTATSTI